MRRIGAIAAGAALSIVLALGVRAGGGSEYDRSSFYAQDALWDASSLQRAGADSASGSNAAKYAWKKINGVIYNGSGVKIPGAVARGIDVSAWQGEINWEKVKSSDVDFAMIRIGHGLRYRDTYFEENMEGAALAGIPAGCYVYSAAANEAEAILEAQMAIERMEGLRVSYP
ncbi:MAG: hypothetical protein IIY55_02040, partial [Blautia sp.]|nr:hypothetical protein [Blautia sp.]